MYQERCWRWQIHCLEHRLVEGDNGGIAEIVEERISVAVDLWPASDQQLQRIREETLKDVQLAALLRMSQSKWPVAKRALSMEVKPFWTIDNYFHILMV